MSLVTIERQLAHKNLQRAKATPDAPDIGAMIKRAITEALDPTKQPAPSVTRPGHWTTSLPPGASPLGPHATRAFEHHLAVEKADNLEATIREAVNEALHAAGVITAPPSPPELPELPRGWVLDRPPPRSLPPPWPDPSPAPPVPIEFPEFAIERDENNCIAVIKGELRGVPLEFRMRRDRNTGVLERADTYLNGRLMPPRPPVPNADMRLTHGRDHLGLIDTVYFDGRPFTKFVRDHDYRIVKLASTQEACRLSPRSMHRLGGPLEPPNKGD